ncbi:MAG: SUMF1/EgtB/PvdO family nonheme iron enzyme [Bauldia sp.]
MVLHEDRSRVEQAQEIDRLVRSLKRARRETDELFRIVREDAIFERPIEERHRIVFYLGHLEAFDRNLLSAFGLDVDSAEPFLDRLFAFGIDPVGGGLPTDAPSDWPSLAEIRRYVRVTRQHVDDRLDREIANAAQGVKALNIAVEHRLMHAETLSYMFHWLPAERKVDGPVEADMRAPSRSTTRQFVPSGKATLGRPQGFGWDNEFPEQVRHVPAFLVDRTKVTNSQFLAFVEAGGYADSSLWSASDWEWRERESLSHPRFWLRGPAGWRYRTMFGDVPLPADWPVYVSHAEAKAFARWLNARLPTEEEYHRAAFGTPEGTEREYPWGSADPSPRHGNFGSQRWNPTGVGAYPAGDSAFGLTDVVGNGWEWTSTPFGPFDGFEPSAFYPGYSADFFDGKHYVLKGASMRTAPVLLRRSFRNWFQGQYPRIYAGFRCVVSA